MKAKERGENILFRDVHLHYIAFYCEWLGYGWLDHHPPPISLHIYKLNKWRFYFVFFLKKNNK